MKIAICDDIKAERENVISALKSVTDDFSADEFESGSELIKRHRSVLYDLIILDILMPQRKSGNLMKKHPSSLYRQARNSECKATAFLRLTTF